MKNKPSFRHGEHHGSTEGKRRKTGDQPVGNSADTEVMYDKADDIMKDRMKFIPFCNSDHIFV